MEIINVSYPNDGLGDKLRDSMIKVNDNFTELLNLINSLDLSISGITGLDDALNTISASITGLQSQISTLDTNHNSDISTINSNVVTINSSIASINGAIADILSQLEPLLDNNATPLVTTTFVDSYRGTRILPATSSTYNGYHVNLNSNTNVGFSVVNTNTGNSALSGFGVAGTSSASFGVGVYYCSPNYFVPYLRDNTAVMSFNDLFILGCNNKSIDFRTGGSTFGTETSKFRIDNNGTISIGATPSTDNTVTKGLARKSNGDLVEFTIPTGGGSTPTLQAVTTAGNIISATVSGNLWENTIQANQIRLRNITFGSPILTINSNGYTVTSSTGVSTYGATTLTSGGIAHTLPITSNSGRIVTVGTTAPSSSSDTGEVGEIRVTSTHIYTCIATDTWVRVAVATW